MTGKKSPTKSAHKKEWFDDDSFWREMYPFMFPAKRLAEADEHVPRQLPISRMSTSYVTARA